MKKGGGELIVAGVATACHLDGSSVQTDATSEIGSVQDEDMFVLVLDTVL